MFIYLIGKLGRFLKNFGNWGLILFLIWFLYYLIIFCYNKKWRKIVILIYDLFIDSFVFLMKCMLIYN